MTSDRKELSAEERAAAVERAVALMRDGFT